MRVAAGKLRHRVFFEEFAVGLDSDGAQEESWVPFTDRPLSAEVRAISGGELIAAQAVQSKVTTRIKVRYRPGLRASMRATHRGTVYNIEAVIPDPDSGRRYLTLLCSSGVNEG